MPPKNNERRKELAAHAIAMYKCESFGVDKIAEGIEDHIELGYFIEMLSGQLMYEFQTSMPIIPRDKLGEREVALLRLASDLIKSKRWLFPAIWLTCTSQMELGYIANNFINRIELAVGMKINARDYKTGEEDDATE